MYWHLDKSLSFHGLFYCLLLTSVCLIFKHFIITRLIKQLDSCRYASVYILRCAYIAEVVDRLRHTHAFSRVNLREFPVKWATMAAPMVSENARFKINVMMYNILTKLNKKLYVLQYSIMNGMWELGGF